jgi:hypothetical protein
MDPIEKPDPDGCAGAIAALFLMALAALIIAAVVVIV